MSLVFKNFPFYGHIYRCMAEIFNAFKAFLNFNFVSLLEEFPVLAKETFAHLFAFIVIIPAELQTTGEAMQSVGFI